MEIVCPTCNKRYNISEDKIPQGKRASATCKNCGCKIVIESRQDDQPDNSFKFKSAPKLQDGSESSPQITEKDFIDFIGPNADKYIEKFSKFNVAGVDHFSLTWNWPAFIVAVFWMLYRKLYLWALLVFILSFIPIAGIILMIACGLTGNYIYYKNVKKKIMELKIQQPSSELSELLQQIGGVNRWLKTLALVLMITTVLGILAAIIIPLIAGKT